MKSLKYSKSSDKMGRKKNDLVWSRFLRKGKGAECTFCKKNYQFANVTKMTNHLLSSFKCPAEIQNQLRSENALAPNFSTSYRETESESDASTSNASSRSTTPTLSITPKTKFITSFMDRITDEENVRFISHYFSLL